MSNAEIVLRFFKVIDTLKANKVIRGEKTFTDRYSINRRNLYQLRQNPERNILQMVWLSHLINDFGVSSQWLMTGEGEMFVPGHIHIPYKKKV